MDNIFVALGLGPNPRSFMLAQVIITEIDPTRAIEAVMDGYLVMPIMEASRIGDIFITISGDKHVIDKAHLEIM